MENITFDILRNTGLQEREALINTLPVFPAEITDEIRQKVFRENFFKDLGIPENKQDIYIDWIYSEGNCFDKSKEKNVSKTWVCYVNRKTELKIGEDRIFFREDCLLDILSLYYIDRKMMMKIFPWMSEKGFCYITARAKRLAKKRRARLCKKNYSDYHGIFEQEVKKSFSTKSFIDTMDKTQQYDYRELWKTKKPNARISAKLHLVRAKGWVISKDKIIRYCPDTDMSFLRQINLEKYRGLLVSANKIYEENSEMLASHGIKDSHELFYLMRQNMKDELTFVRVPVIGVGKNVTLEDHIMRIIDKHNPADMRDVCRISWREYGFMLANRQEVKNLL